MRGIFGLLGLSLVLLMLGVSPALAQSTTPQAGETCSQPGMIYGTITGAGNDGNMMACNGSTWVSLISCNNDKTLEPKGDFMLGTSTGLNCSAPNTGALRYNAADQCVEFCDGTSWACLAVVDR